MLGSSRFDEFLKRVDLEKLIHDLAGQKFSCLAVTRVVNARDLSIFGHLISSGVVSLGASRINFSEKESEQVGLGRMTARIRGVTGNRDGRFQRRIEMRRPRPIEGDLEPEDEDLHFALRHFQHVASRGKLRFWAEKITHRVRSERHASDLDFFPDLIFVFPGSFFLKNP
jgi:hypothetical protein